MKYLPGDLLYLIPRAELDRKLKQDYCEIDPSFLCFENNYIPIANNVPKDYIIVDCGCYMAAQSYLFTEFKQYVGVDSYDIYTPLLERFKTENSYHIKMNLKDFLKTDLIKKEKTYFICSAVPSFKETSQIYQQTENCALFYPGQQPLIKGICAETIKKEYEELERNELSMYTLKTEIER